MLLTATNRFKDSVEVGVYCGDQLKRTNENPGHSSDLNSKLASQVLDSVLCSRENLDRIVVWVFCALQVLCCVWACDTT